MVGPLGRGAQMDKYGLVVCVATGIGAAQILPICRGLKKKGNKVIGIIGAKSKKVLMLEAQMRVVCDEIFIATNDGCYERKGLATELLKELLNKYTVHRIYAIGSVEMMQAAAQMTRDKEYSDKGDGKSAHGQWFGLVRLLQGKNRRAIPFGLRRRSGIRRAFGGLSGFITTYECIGVGHGEIKPILSAQRNQD